MGLAFTSPISLPIPIGCSTPNLTVRNTVRAAHEGHTTRNQVWVGRRCALALGLAAALPIIWFEQQARSEAGDGLAIRLSEEEWRERLEPAAYRVLREAGTERPFSSPLNDEKRKGTFVCAGCKSSLFSSDTKFESGTGWPSFFDALPKAVTLHRTPADFLLARTEVRCANCGGHLGHVFNDGPRPTGKRYCMNGVALGFILEKA